MDNKDRHAAADQLTRRRTRMFAVLAILFISQQASFFAQGDGRPVDHVKISAWIVLSIVLLLALGTGGAWFQPKEVRDLANDETTRAHRQKACFYGFWAAMGTALGLYVVALFEPVSGREAVHIIMTVAIGTALLNFAAMERRALRDA